MKKVTMGLLSVVLLFSVASSALAAPSVSSQANISAKRECPSAGAVQPIYVGKKWPIPTKGASYSIASEKNIEITGRHVLAHEPGLADVKVYDKNDKCIARYYIAASY